jgi:hypothetical protein
LPRHCVGSPDHAALLLLLLRLLFGSLENGLLVLETASFGFTLLEKLAHALTARFVLPATVHITSRKMSRGETR